LLVYAVRYMFFCFTQLGNPKTHTHTHTLTHTTYYMGENMEKVFSLGTHVYRKVLELEKRF